MSSRVLVYADGGSRGNPGPAGFGAAVVDAATGEVLAERKQYLGVHTNNVAEYRGLIAGLAAAAELGAREVSVRMDSKLVVEQMSGRWQVKHPSMRPLAAEAARIGAQFDRVDYAWIPREQNKHADRLANEAMDAGATAPEGGGVRPPKPTPASARNAIPAATPTPQNSWLPPDEQATRLILLRHGVTEHTIARRFAGRSDLPLTRRGRLQAESAARRIREIGAVDAVISSPLGRALQTAEIVADEFGAAVETESGFIETDFGDWDGLTFAEVQQRWPDELTAWMADASMAPPNGESFDDVARRVRRARDRVFSGHAGQIVVVVSHVTPIKTLIRLALDAPQSALYRMFLEPASISVIDYYSSGPVTVRSVNDAAHLVTADSAEPRPAIARH